LRCAKEFGLKARERIAGWERLETTPMPAIAVLRDGGFLLLGKFADGKVVVLSPHSQRPAVMTKAEFEAISDGRVVLMTRGATLADMSRRFDVTSFLGAIHKYRRIGISAFATPLFRKRLDEKFQRGAENQAFLVESVTGVETLKAMAIEPQMQRRWEEQLAGYVASSFRVLQLGNVASQSVQLVSKAVTAAVLYVGAKLVIDGGLTVGELVAFNILAGRVSAPVLRLAQIWQDFHQARLSVARLGDILNTTPEPIFNPSRAALPAIRGAVAFEHVTFRYRIDGPEVLHDVSFKVDPGQVVGIVGPSGSGKSTLAKLVQRLYVAESGRVLVDGADLAMVDTAWLRRQVGVVLQENVLFNRSVRDNIALADPAISIERVIAAATLAGAHDFILELPEGYDTIVGERGSSLSGGQRQRIEIARALITNPRIVIFDEATSALDYESERIIQDNMREIAKGRTVFIIAHRLSTVRWTDRIITIDRGRLVEDGTHDRAHQYGRALCDAPSAPGGHPCSQLNKRRKGQPRTCGRRCLPHEPIKASTSTSSHSCRPHWKLSKRRRRRWVERSCSAS
jgi:subfamily B ATP-binding cassette protein HlyB/CyaB